MTLLLVMLAIGVLNAAVSYDQRILMLATHGSSLEAWVEAVFYVILWPIQLAWWIGMQVWRLMDWVHAKWEAFL